MIRSPNPGSSPENSGGGRLAGLAEATHEHPGKIGPHDDRQGQGKEESGLKARTDIIPTRDWRKNDTLMPAWVRVQASEQPKHDPESGAMALDGERDA